VRLHNEPGGNVWRRMMNGSAAVESGVRTWQLDGAHTVVEFSVKHMMITTVRGRFRDIEGELEFGEGAGSPGGFRAEARIAAASVDTGVAARDEHLRSGDFFDAEAHPHLVFRSQRVEGTPRRPGDRFKVIGELTIRDVTKELVLDATFEGTGRDPYGQDKIGFTADAVIDRREYGLNWNQALEAGGLLVSNEIKVRLEVQATGA
jgi:polyisoprenoid-binding protein YceI